jgi:hypothetical protein
LSFTCLNIASWCTADHDQALFKRTIVGEGAHHFHYFSDMHVPGAQGQFVTECMCWQRHSVPADIITVDNELVNVRTFIRTYKEL